MDQSHLDPHVGMDIRELLRQNNTMLRRENTMFSNSILPGTRNKAPAFNPVAHRARACSGRPDDISFEGAVEREVRMDAVHGRRSHARAEATVRRSRP